MAEAKSDNADNSKRYMKFGCPYCGQAGVVVWRGTGANRVLVRLSNGFHVETRRAFDTRQAIICDICDEIDAVKEQVTLYLAAGETHSSQS